MRHVDDEVLAAFALGDTDDLAPEEVAAAAAHADSCAECGRTVDALRETLLLVTGGTGPDGAGGPGGPGGADGPNARGPETLVAPPASVWAGIEREIAASRPAPTVPADGPAAPSDGPADPPQAPVVSLAERRRGIPTWLASTAAAVALLVGVGGGWLAGQGGDPDDPAQQATVVASTELASLDDSPQDRGAAQVRRHDDRVVLHVEASDLGGPDGIREVWLINVDGTRMVSMGLLPDGESGDFEFPERLLEEGYRIVDISYEPDDGDPVHSGRSLARGTIQG